VARFLPTRGNAIVEWQSCGRDEHQRSHLTALSLGAIAPRRRRWRNLLRSRDAHFDLARCSLAPRGQQGGRPVSARRAARQTRRWRGAGPGRSGATHLSRSQSGQRSFRAWAVVGTRGEWKPGLSAGTSVTLGGSVPHRVAQVARRRHLRSASADPVRVKAFHAAACSRRPTQRGRWT
jgi:hypothetical protein